MASIPFTRGLHAVGNGVHAYVQPDGSWGWSNAGLVTDGDAALVVDTLFDRQLTRTMLAAMRDAQPRARMDTLVNTHANGDHCWGNQELPGAQVIASRKAAEEMRHLPPSRVNAMVTAARLAGVAPGAAALASRAFHGARLDPLADLLDAAPFVERIFGPFQFGGITLTLPTRTFDDALTLHVGARRVDLLEVGPAHTRGDVVVHVPDASVVFTGDILFMDGHPVVWEGPLSNWVHALDRVIALAPAVVVPGHGPVTDVNGARRLREYLVYVEEQAVLRHAAGMDAETAAKDIALDGFRGWLDAERIAINVETVYRHLEGRADKPVNVVAMFARMARVARAMSRG